MLIKPAVTAVLATVVSLSQAAPAADIADTTNGGVLMSRDADADNGTVSISAVTNAVRFVTYPTVSSNRCLGDGTATPWIRDGTCFSFPSSGVQGLVISQFGSGCRFSKYLYILG
jgi:hypothetical protein